MDKHTSLARELGYEGQELRDYLKRQQDLERGGGKGWPKGNMKEKKREADQKEKDREQKDKEREQKRERLGIRKKCAARKDKELELEKLKLEAAQKEKYKEMEMEKLKIEAEVELKKIKAEATSHPWGPKEKSSNPRSPKLPYFDEHTDKMYSYLTILSETSKPPLVIFSYILKYMIHTWLKFTLNMKESIKAA